MMLMSVGQRVAAAPRGVIPVFFAAAAARVGGIGGRFARWAGAMALRGSFGRSHQVPVAQSLAAVTLLLGLLRSISAPQVVENLLVRENFA